jgi:hypothetical protein
MQKANKQASSPFPSFISPILDTKITVQRQKEKGKEKKRAEEPTNKKQKKKTPETITIGGAMQRVRGDKKKNQKLKHS